MDRRCGGDSNQAGTQGEDGSGGCATPAALAVGGSFSADLGAELGKPRSTAIVVAPAPHGAGTHPDHEPVASGSPQRRTAREEEVVAGMRTAATGVVPLSSLGEPATTGSAGVAGSTESDDCRAEPSGRSGSGEVSGSPALDEPSRGGSADGFGLHTHHWGGRAIWLRQADCQLCRTGAAGEVERESATARTYHEAGKLHVALLAGGSGPSHSPQHPGMAQPIFPSEDLPRDLALGNAHRDGE